MEYIIPAIKGVQAKLPYYVCMVTIWKLMELLEKTSTVRSGKPRAQRQLNKARIPEIRDYVLNNPQNYVFSAVTLCVDGELRFVENSQGLTPPAGELHLDEHCRSMIIDGQHRLAALKSAMEKNPYVGFEHMPVVVFRDFGFERSQQMFSDLNRRVVKPTKSLNILYDKRDPLAKLVCRLTNELPLFKETVELEKASVSVSSDKLFTLSAIYNATSELLHGVATASFDEKYQLAYDFWSQLSQCLSPWICVLNKSISAAEVRSSTICTQAITLIALGRCGSYCYMKYHEFQALDALTNINWMRDNERWSSILVTDNKVSGSRVSMQSLAAYLIQVVSREGD